jgi:hypothetical protein
MIFIPLGLAHILHANVLPHYLFASVSKRMSSVVMTLFRRLPRKVDGDGCISLVSDLSTNSSFDEFHHCEMDDSIHDSSTECSGVECDDDTFVSCNSVIHDDWHSAVSQSSSLRKNENTVGHMKLWLPICPRDDFGALTVALEVVPIYSPFQRIALSLQTVAYRLHHYDNEMLSVDPCLCFPAIPMIEECLDDIVDSPHELYDKKGWLYRICKSSYRITMMIFSFVD